MKLPLLLLALVLALPARAAPAILELPDDWYPESLAAGPDGSLYVGSWRQGAVVRLAPDGSKPQMLVPPGSNGLANGQGVLVDAQAGLLWVCSGTLGFTTVPMTPSALKSYDLATGAPRGNYPMPDDGYCNDLAQDRIGTLFVTDSYHPRLLRLGRGDQALRVWLDDAALGSGDRKFFLNGIAVDPTGALYVSAVMAVPYILRVDPAGRVSRMAAPRTLRNVDAIRVAGPGRLVLFESNAFGGDGPYGGAVTLARIEGEQIAGLTTLAAGLNDPSSGLILDGRVYYIESKYGLLLAHPGDDAAVPRRVPFDVRSVPLPD
jgi:hypothetical protein